MNYRKEIEKLYKEGILYAMALNMTRQSGDDRKECAIDLVQDTIERLFTQERLYNDRQKLPAFIKVVMKRIYLNDLRREEVHNRYHTIHELSRRDLLTFQGDSYLKDRCYIKELSYRVKQEDREMFNYMCAGYNAIEISNITGVGSQIIRRRVKRIRSYLQ
jgi:DNA-directed RNA polymerase specialized sigma24 family protein